MRGRLHSNPQKLEGFEVSSRPLRLAGAPGRGLKHEGFEVSSRPVRLGGAPGRGPKLEGFEVSSRPVRLGAHRVEGRNSKVLRFLLVPCDLGVPSA